MSRWDTFPWGNGTLWGASTNDALAWGVEIDWDGDGAFDGSNEADRMIGIQSFRGRKSLLDPVANFSSIETGTLTIMLTNSDGRYDIYNTASPLYPNVRQGVDARIRVVDLATNTIYALFYGVVTEVQASNYGTEPTVTVRIEDCWRTLRRAVSYISRLRTGVPIDLAIKFILDSINWPDRWGRNLDSTTKEIRHFWSSDSRSAGKELENVAQSILGYFFLDATGQATFQLPESNFISVLDLSQADLLKDMVITQPWQNQRTVTKIKVHPRKTITSATVYSLSSPIRMESGVPIRLWMDFVYNNVRVPVNVINYVSKTANTAEDGSGTNVSSQVDVVYSNSPETAETRPLDLTFTGSGVAYLTSVSVNGWPYPEEGTLNIVYPASQITDENAREFVLDLPWVQDANQAQVMVDVLGPFLATEHPYLIISMEARPDKQFVPDLFDVINVSIDKLGIDAKFRVGGIEHRSSGPNCQSVITTFYLEFYNGANYWTWPITNFGTDTIFGW